MAILLTNGTYIDPETLTFSSTHLLVEEGVHGKISQLNEIPENNTSPIIDCTGKYITKSFANGHPCLFGTRPRNGCTAQKSGEFQ